MHVIVVGKKESLRNPRLLTLTSFGFDLDFVDPVFPSAPQLENPAEQMLNRALLGRKLSAGEIGCWLAHASVRRRIAEKRCHEWHIVLEDDADCEFMGDASEFNDFVQQLNRNTEKSVIVNLYGRNAASSAAPRALRRLSAPFAGTVGYMANFQAMSQVNSWGVVMTADWPLHLQKASFYEITPPMVREVFSESLIGDIERATSAWGFYASAPLRFFRALALKVPLGIAARAVALNPLLRDIKNRLTKL
ncbi:MAG: hypothetical protein RIQ37_717 [Actinomycetota bacterium]